MSQVTIAISLDVVGPLTVISPPPGPVIVGVSYRHEFVATGGTPPYTWSHDAASGRLPDGLTLSPNGVLSGTVPPHEQAGEYSFNLSVTDSFKQ